MKRMLLDAFERWKDALVDQNKQSTQPATVLTRVSPVWKT
jgi:hypothetical protein